MNKERVIIRLDKPQITAKNYEQYLPKDLHGPIDRLSREELLALTIHNKIFIRDFCEQKFGFVPNMYFVNIQPTKRSQQVRYMTWQKDTDGDTIAKSTTKSIFAGTVLTLTNYEENKPLPKYTGQQPEQYIECVTCNEISPDKGKPTSLKRKNIYVHNQKVHNKPDYTTKDNIIDLIQIKSCRVGYMPLPQFLSRVHAGNKKIKRDTYNKQIAKAICLIRCAKWLQHQFKDVNYITPSDRVYD